MINKMAQIKKLLVRWCTNQGCEGCCHSNIVQPTATWNEWQLNYWCYYFWKQSPVIRLLFILHCSMLRCAILLWQYIWWYISLRSKWEWFIVLSIYLYTYFLFWREEGGTGYWLEVLLLHLRDKIITVS